MMRVKLLSSLEKCFMDENVVNKRALAEKISFLKNEIYSFQICYDRDETVDAKVIVGYEDITIYSPCSTDIVIRCLYTRGRLYPTDGRRCGKD